MKISAKILREIKRPFKQLGRCFRMLARNLAGYNDLSQTCRDLHNDLRESLQNTLRATVQDALRETLRNTTRHILENDNLSVFDHLTYLIQRSVSTAVLHQKTFSRFKNIHQGQEIVVVGNGPTAKEYKRIDHAIHIGVNRAFLLENIDLDYLFLNHQSEIPEANEQYISQGANLYRPESCIKFYGLLDPEEWYGLKHILSESDTIKSNALRYRINITGHKFTHLIDTELLGSFGSVIFPAMQFALWTNPRTIYLVGCDCSEGHFYGQDGQKIDASVLIPFWIQFKEFAQMHYPETKIISINPVGLKGVFESLTVNDSQ